MKQLDKAILSLKNIAEWLYQYRYAIAILIFILCIVLEISGSSIGMWKNWGGMNVEADGVLFGKPRSIRSDEWAVLTPMMFSQYFDGFGYFSDLIRGGNTDVFMIYGLPTLNLMQIFRPFQLGFLFLGIAKGLSFFWCGRWLALFLVMFELAMILTKKNKLLSLLAAIMITLAPMIQWWFAINGIVELFVFGGLAIVLLEKYMTTTDLKKRAIYLLGMVICAGGYIMVLYPAWQIPMFYVFLALAIWVIVKNRKECSINYKDVISIVLAIGLFAGCMFYIFSQSLDTIKAVMNTVYPGTRNEETGGGTFFNYFDYMMNIFIPLKGNDLTSAHTYIEVMFGLFPMGIILSMVAMWKEKKKDLLLILLLLVYVFLSVWCIFGFPKILAKITLLNHSMAMRTLLAVGFLDILILIRALTISQEPFSRKWAIPISVCLSVVMGILCKSYNAEYVSKKMLVAMVLMCIYLFYFVLRYKAKYANILFVCGMIPVMLVSRSNCQSNTKGSRCCI